MLSLFSRSSNSEGSGGTITRPELGSLLVNWHTRRSVVITISLMQPPLETQWQSGQKKCHHVTTCPRCEVRRPSPQGWSLTATTIPTSQQPSPSSILSNHKSSPTTTLEARCRETPRSTSTHTPRPSQSGSTLRTARNSHPLRPTMTPTNTSDSSRPTWASTVPSTSSNRMSTTFTTSNSTTIPTTQEATTPPTPTGDRLTSAAAMRPVAPTVWSASIPAKRPSCVNSRRSLGRMQALRWSSCPTGATITSTPETSLWTGQMVAAMVGPTVTMPTVRRQMVVGTGGRSVARRKVGVAASSRTPNCPCSSFSYFSCLLSSSPSRVLSSTLNVSDTYVTLHN